MLLGRHGNRRLIVAASRLPGAALHVHQSWQKMSSVAFLTRPSQRRNDVSAHFNLPDSSRMFCHPPTALHLPCTGRPGSHSRIVKTVFTLVIERPKVLNCLQLSLTIARI